jgi:hypothetical protein
MEVKMPHYPFRFIPSIVGVTILAIIIAIPWMLLTVAHHAAPDRPYTAEELGGVGMHCAERLSRPLQVVEGNCFQVYSDGTFELIDQANGYCTGDEKSWCSFRSFRKMPDIDLTAPQR